jgi:hypothetical protein
VRTRGYRDGFFLKVVAAAQAGDPETLAAVLRLPAAPEATPDTRSSSA